jgi:hypothetical protein
VRLWRGIDEAAAAARADATLGGGVAQNAVTEGDAPHTTTTAMQRATRINPSSRATIS